MAATTQSNLETTVRDLAAKDAINDVICRYCHGIDRRDWQVLNNVFWPDSRLEYGLYNDSGAGFANIIKQLDLLRPIYRQTTNYGHFGKAEMPWEQINKTKDLLAAAK